MRTLILKAYILTRTKIQYIYYYRVPKKQKKKNKKL
jgi:hypothetical protein